MKKIILGLIILIVFGGVIFYMRQQPVNQITPPVIDPTPITTPNQAKPAQIVADNLEIPWDLAFLPNGQMLITERPGRFLLINAQGVKKNILNLNTSGGEGGMLGLTLHPQFNNNHWIYLYLGQKSSGGETINKVNRYRLEGEKLVEEKLIIGNIPGAIYHDGGRLEFGPDGYLYITTGDATRPNLAQDKNSLAGKILRLRDDGTIPPDNPFNTAVYSYGHRNPQGLAWDNAGRLWENEHGRSGTLSGLDEINLIEAGKNYGWPEIEGDKIQTGMEQPVIHSGANTTWAPASLVYLNGRLFFGGLRGETLYEAVLDGEKITEIKTHFHQEFGRLRTVRVGLDNMLYLTTSNRDGRGTPHTGDDKIIRMDPRILN